MNTQYLNNFYQLKVSPVAITSVFMPHHIENPACAGSDKGVSRSKYGEELPEDKVHERRQRANRSMRELLECNMLGRKCHLITLTFDNDSPAWNSAELAVKYTSDYVRRIRYNHPSDTFDYVYVIERGTRKSKRFHVHMITMDLPVPGTLQRKRRYRGNGKWYYNGSLATNLFALWPHGRIRDIRPIRNTPRDIFKVSRYVSKYFSKDNEMFRWNVRSFRSSLGLKRYERYDKNFFKWGNRPEQRVSMDERWWPVICKAFNRAKDTVLKRFGNTYRTELTYEGDNRTFLTLEVETFLRAGLFAIPPPTI